MNRGVLAVCAIAAACAPNYPQPVGPVRTRLEVTVPGPLAQAFTRLQAAWMAEGLTIERSDAAGGNLESQAILVVIRSFPLQTVQVVCHANVIGMSDSVTIALTAHGLFGAGVEGSVAVMDQGPYAEVWGRLQRVALSLRAR